MDNRKKEATRVVSEENEKDVVRSTAEASVVENASSAKTEPKADTVSDVSGAAPVVAAVEPETKEAEVTVDVKKFVRNCTDLHHWTASDCSIVIKGSRSVQHYPVPYYITDEESFSTLKRAMKIRSDADLKLDISELYVVDTDFNETEVTEVYVSDAVYLQNTRNASLKINQFSDDYSEFSVYIDDVSKSSLGRGLLMATPLNTHCVDYPVSKDITEDARRRMAIRNAHGIHRLFTVSCDLEVRRSVLKVTGGWEYPYVVKEKTLKDDTGLDNSKVLADVYELRMTTGLEELVNFNVFDKLSESFIRQMLCYVDYVMRSGFGLNGLSDGVTLRTMSKTQLINRLREVVTKNDNYIGNAIVILLSAAHYVGI